MPKLENIKFGAEIDPVQDLTEMEIKVSKKVENIFRNNVTLESKLLNPEDLTLEPERTAELKAELRLITEQTKIVQNKLPQTGEADSYRYDIAA